MKRFSAMLAYLVLAMSFNTSAVEKNYFDTFPYACNQMEQPSSVAYFKQYSPHMLIHAIDIDFVVKQTGVCTSLLIALMEQETGLIRRHTVKRKPWIQPFGQLSKKYGFIAQLVDVAVKLRQLKNRAYSGYLPANEKMAYLFNVQMPVGTPNRLLQIEARAQFKTLYRDMFMLEYVPTYYLHSSDFGLKQDLLLRSWQFRQDMVRPIFAVA
ncbi:hypothetical protein [Rheinheimera texasensis]|uniref:hypothetical protein n=1 Tax=Rheinheimera texasensis TaxID=306205 RepID=UPI0004E20CAA|nr:hypothetical protein [Rheinheimera texasensis]